MEARWTQSRACSCSYSNSVTFKGALTSRVCPRLASSLSHGGRSRHKLDRSRLLLNHRPRSTPADYAEPPGNPSDDESPRQKITGFTPADYVSFSEKPEDACHHMAAVTVQAPASTCFAFWNDWDRLVDFLDLVAQIGLDPNFSDLALFQCFYRWGMLPVLEIVFLLQKTHVEEDKLITFESIHGMPLFGEVQFIESEDKTATTVIFKLQHQLPNLLRDVKVFAPEVQISCRTIFGENLACFRRLAEAAAASDPATAGLNTPPVGAGDGASVADERGGSRLTTAADNNGRHAEPQQARQPATQAQSTQPGDGQQGLVAQKAAAAAASPPPTAQESSPSSSESKPARQRGAKTEAVGSSTAKSKPPSVPAAPAAAKGKSAAPSAPTAGKGKGKPAVPADPAGPAAASTKAAAPARSAGPAAAKSKPAVPASSAGPAS